MIQLCRESMTSRGGGAVVNVSSISGFVAQTGRWTYNTAKGAVNQLTRCAALDLAADGPEQFRERARSASDSRVRQY